MARVIRNHKQTMQLHAASYIGKGIVQPIGTVTPVPMPTPVLLESFDSLTGQTQSGGTGVIDTVNKVQGTGALRMQGNGTSGTSPFSTKTIGTVDPSAMGVIAWYVNALSERDISGAGIQFGRSSTFSGLNAAFSRSIGIGRPQGGYWFAADASEEPTLPTGAASTDLRIRTTQNAPYATDVAYDAVYANAKGRPTAIISFDDNENTMLSFAKPRMDTYGMKGTAFIAPTGSNGVGVSDSLTWAEIRALDAAGWDMACDGTSDDTPMTAQASVAAAVANIQSVQAALASNGVSNRGANHFCYPNGYYAGDASGVQVTPVQVAAMTSNGTTTVTFGTAANVTNGMNAYGFGIPAGTTVVSGGGTGVTSVVLSNAVATNTKAAQFIDQSGAFYLGKLQAGLSAAGFLTGRTTLGGTLYDRFGIGGQALYLPGQGVSGLTLAQMKAHVDQCMLRGTTVYFYFHRIVPDDTVTVGINITESNFAALINYIGGFKNAGQMDVLTISQYRARFAAASPP